MISGNPSRFHARSIARYPPAVKEKKGRKIRISILPNLFGLLSLASLVCSIIMAPAGSAPTPTGQPTARRNSKRLLVRRRAADFVSSSPVSLSVKFIYLVNRPAVRWILFLSMRKKRNEGERKKEEETGRRGKGRNSDREAPLFRFVARPPVTYTSGYVFRSHEILSAFPIALCLVACLSDRERSVARISRRDFPGILITIACTSDP